MEVFVFYLAPARPVQIVQILFEDLNIDCKIIRKESFAKSMASRTGMTPEQVEWLRGVVWTKANQDPALDWIPKSPEDFTLADGIERDWDGYFVRVTDVYLNRQILVRLSEENLRKGDNSHLMREANNAYETRRRNEAAELRRKSEALRKIAWKAGKVLGLCSLIGAGVGAAWKYGINSPENVEKRAKEAEISNYDQEASWLGESLSGEIFVPSVPDFLFSKTREEYVLNGSNVVLTTVRGSNEVSTANRLCLISKNERRCSEYWIVNGSDGPESDAVNLERYELFENGNWVEKRPSLDDRLRFAKDLSEIAKQRRERLEVNSE